MSDIPLSEILDKATEEVNKASQVATYAPKANGNGPILDIGAENMDRTAELTSDALRNVFEECARRTLETAEANLAQAQKDLDAAKEVAEGLRACGEAMAQQNADAIARAKTIAMNTATTRVAIEKMPERLQ